MRVFVIGSLRSPAAGEPDREDVFSAACEAIGAALFDAGHDLSLCSPFQDAADPRVLQGARNALGPATGQIHFFFPDAPSVRDRLDAITTESDIRHPQSPPWEETRDAWRNAWLLSQLAALDASDVVVAIGGAEAGSAGLLLSLARSRRTPILPYGFLDGAARRVLESSVYELEDRIGQSGVSKLATPDGAKACAELVEALTAPGLPSAPGAVDKDPLFFISYARDRPQEADIVETLLRRRGFVVHRDESTFGAGHEIHSLVRESIYRADVFIALWCREYACSPWCFDELEQALTRRREMSHLWIFCVDATRIVPPRARNLLHYPAQTRDALQAQLVTLLDVLALRPGTSQGPSKESQGRGGSARQ